jgi:hypothetical protein
MRPSFHRVVALGFLSAMFVTVISFARPTFAASEPVTRISVFGDSVLLGATDQLIARLAPLEVSVDAHENLSLLGAISVLQAARPTLGGIVVLDLGYNDGTDLTAFRQRIDGAMAALADVPRVIWLNQRDFAVGRAAMNGELAAAAGRYPNLEVVDWNSAVATNPGLVYSDGIHLTAAGQVAMAALVRERVDAYIASTQPTTPAPTKAAAPAPALPDVVPDGRADAPRTRASTRDSSSGLTVFALIAAGALVASAAALTAWRRRWASRVTHPQSSVPARRSQPGRAAGAPRWRGSPRE